MLGTILGIEDIAVDECMKDSNFMTLSFEWGKNRLSQNILVLFQVIENAMDKRGSQ